MLLRSRTLYTHRSQLIPTVHATAFGRLATPDAFKHAAALEQDPPTNRRGPSPPIDGVGVFEREPIPLPSAEKKTWIGKRGVCLKCGTEHTEPQDHTYTLEGRDHNTGNYFEYEKSDQEPIPLPAASGKSYTEKFEKPFSDELEAAIGTAACYDLLRKPVLESQRNTENSQNSEGRNAMNDKQDKQMATELGIER